MVPPYLFRYCSECGTDISSMENPFATMVFLKEWNPFTKQLGIVGVFCSETCATAWEADRTVGRAKDDGQWNATN